MKNNLETNVNSAAQQSDPALRSAQAPPGRASRPGRFSHLLKNFNITRDVHPKALVRSGKSVTFSGVAFFDQFGNRIDLDDQSSLKRTEEGHRGRRPHRTDSHLNREMALSENQGSAVFVPGFKKRAAEHLLLTDQLRMQILSGEVETPGNKSDVLKKRLVDELKADEEHDPQLWLQEFNSHMISSAEGDAALLVAQAAAITNGDKQMQRARKELKNPLEKDVQPFAPPRLSKQTKSPQTGRDESIPVKVTADSKPAIGKPKTSIGPPINSTNSSKLPEFKSEVGEKPSLDIPEKKAQSVRVELNRKPSGNLLTQLRAQVGPARSQAWSNARSIRENDGELRVSSLSTPKAVPRVTIERTTETATDFNKPSVGQDVAQKTRASRPSTRPDTILADHSRTRSARYVEPRVAEEAVVTANRSATGQNSDKVAAGEAGIRGEARSRVASMERSGWHVHTPKANNGKSSDTRVGRPTSANRTKPSTSGSERTRKNRVQPNGQGNTGRNKKSAAPDDASVIKPAVGKGSIVSSLASFASGKG
ncbi:MAG TPA: hypothetical protein ENH10_07555, partial [Bacteroidetes bacterium]|nr:hypothetical protein [Bacteroidota bacterium]HEX04994.1 hypothetical protein [Bacteroidota bacterium]